MHKFDLMFQDIDKPLRLTFPEFNKKRADLIPNCAILNQEFNVYNQKNRTLTFHPQDSSLPNPEMGYEERIFLTGIIATRKNNWHDFFNAMVWHKYPKIKASINAIHHQELLNQKDNKRSRKRDILTLFDECGLVIIAKKDFLDLIRNHSWRELFIKNKHCWNNGQIKVYTFGHAMFEKYLNPYIGMTAQALLLENPETDLDEQIAQGILNQQLLTSKSELSPLPVLGIPGWHPEQTQEFYSNKNYFR